jgi:C1A family cysteine protease
MSIVGYDDAISRFIVRNSWGDAWGKGGYCFFPYSYLTNRNLANDFWVIKSINDTAHIEIKNLSAVSNISWWRRLLKKILNWE